MADFPTCSPQILGSKRRGSCKHNRALIGTRWGSAGGFAWILLVSCCLNSQFERLRDGARAGEGEGRAAGREGRR